jgi:hypothetical protein
MAEARRQRRIAVHRDGVARFAERVRRQGTADCDGGGEHGEAPRESSRMEARSMADGNAADQSGSDSLLIG